MELKYLFWLLDSQNTHVYSMFTTEAYLWHFKENIFVFPTFKIFKIQTFFFEFQK